ncbi:MAG: virulence-associated E family protein, partial [Phormidesmis sp. CAN_BIN44]|nr:virulence-associated E family protein [Phormidesmis sp. CAN_BIN44]
RVLNGLGIDAKDEGVVTKLESFAAAHLSSVKAEIAKGEFTSENLSEINGFYFWQACSGDPVYSDFLSFFKMGARLRFNTLKKRVELDGKEVDVGVARTWLNINHDFKAKTKVDFAEILVQAAKLHSYSPVVEYLDAVYAKHGSDTSILEGLAERYFGQSDPIYNVIMKRTLISAMARGYQHGCKADTALILQGKQGRAKSTFFKVLAGGDEYFTDSFGNSSDKDERLKIHEVWFCEWAELETVFRRKDVAATKAFLSSSVDLVRPPYGRTTQRMERCSIFVGTTNQSEFLSDSTGNRRFWIVPVIKDIDIKLLKTERDRIWAAAVELYKNGENWWLTDLEEAAAAEIAENFRTSDPWLPILAAYLSDKDSTTTNQVMQEALQLDISKRDRGLEMRVGNILRDFGYERQQTRIDGQRAYVYKRVSLPSLPVTTLNSKVVTATNEPERVFHDGVTTVTTLNSKTQEKKTNELENITQVLPKSGSDSDDSNQKPGRASVSPVITLLDKLVTGSDGVVTGRNAFKEGDIVRYVGAKHSIYLNKSMVIAQVNDGMVNCHIQDGGFTTWFYPSDLALES